MNKNTLFIVAFAVIFLFGAGVYIVMSRSINSDIDLTDANSIIDDVISGEKSLRDLMTTSSNIACTFDDTESGVEGEIFVANGNMRGDFIAQMNGTTVNSNMISTSEKVYVWSDESDQGMVFTLEDIEEFDVENEVSSSVDLDEEYNYNCRSWKVDNSVFQLPDNIEFIDYSEMLTQLEFMTGNDDQTIQGTSEQCAACESLSDDARSACLQALGC